MESIKIQFQPSVKEKLIRFLETFSINELNIVEEKHNIKEESLVSEYAEKLQLESKKTTTGKSKVRSIDQLDEAIEKLISSYEN